MSRFRNLLGDGAALRILLMKPTVLRFVLRKASPTHPIHIMSKFRPNGRIVLNRTEWRGKEPRTCGVTQVRSRPHSGSGTEPLEFEIEVSCRPKGFINYVGHTKYDGWTAILLDRDRDGTLLDGHGNPLAEGEAPVPLPYEVYEDIDFNELDFGEFVGESDVPGVKRRQHDDVMREVGESGEFSMSLRSTFMAPRRQRPYVKLVLSSAPGATRTDGFGTRIVYVSKSTPHVEQVLMDRMVELVSGFIEGRYSLKTVTASDFVLVELSDALVDCTPNEEGRESRFNCLSDYVSGVFFEELAKRLMATYEVDVTIVEGENTALLLRRVGPERL